MNKIEMNLAEWAWKRLMSCSPEFAKYCRAVAFVVMAIMKAILWLLANNYIQLQPHYAVMLTTIATDGGIFFTGIFGMTWFDTTDPALKSPSTVKAIEEAAKDLTPVSLGHPIGPEPDGTLLKNA